MGCCCSKSEGNPPPDPPPLTACTICGKTHVSRRPLQDPLTRRPYRCKECRFKRRKKKMRRESSKTVKTPRDPYLGLSSGRDKSGVNVPAAHVDNRSAKKMKKVKKQREEEYKRSEAQRPVVQVTETSAGSLKVVEVPEVKRRPQSVQMHVPPTFNTSSKVGARSVRNIVPIPVQRTPSISEVSVWTDVVPTEVASSLYSVDVVPPLRVLKHGGTNF
ncbi:hypothetical protein EDC01DRAFT_345419 [Geopyxis carbonaria]|nr:hypothetical protein EDC01DRAFT_345419 [Geopyxis carbonaria]